MQGGLNATRMPDGSLKSVTGSAGNDIYRGHRLPKDLVGDYLYGEPVGRIVRRIRSEKKEGLTYLHNVYPNNEFIKSLDPLFRPVDVTTAPDGTVYITDMYHGIIQVGNFAGPGTYLRARIQQYRPGQDHSQGPHLAAGLRRRQAGPIGCDGRDRIAPRMNNETPAQLVRHLSHPNGWWRDTAQQLLVLKQDKSVVPALLAIVKSRRTCWRGSTRCGRSKGWARSARRWCVSRWRIPSRGCASRRSAPAKRSTRPVIARWPTTTRA